jgi:SPP1 family predicted phage head-tail adaptor
MNGMVTIGELRDAVTIQKPALAKDSSGSTAETFADWQTVYARIRPLSTREYMAAGQVQSEVTHEIIIRFLKNIAGADRVKWGVKYFLIESITDYDGRGRWTKLLAVERNEP